MQPALSAARVDTHARMGPVVKRPLWLNYCFRILLSFMLLTPGWRRSQEARDRFQLPVRGEYARVRSSVVARYQGSIHGLIVTHRNRPISLAAATPSMCPAMSNFPSKRSHPSAFHHCRSSGRTHTVAVAPSGSMPFSTNCQRATTSLRNHIQASSIAIVRALRLPALLIP